ncbi:MAG: M42 family metallopeptidase [Mycoplasmataceae bacterium]|nr:M42 family metallopeptidase [Mycoplasmataceae bacterium]
MNTKDQNLFNKLKIYMDIDGMSRYEEDVANELKKTLNKNLEYSRDGLGSMIINQIEKNNGPIIQIAAHMDEVGFIVQDILDNGQIRLSMIGGVWPLTVIGTKGVLILNNGNKLAGVFGHTSIHILEIEKRAKAPELKELFLDIGFSSKKEVEDSLVEVGNRVCLTGEVFSFGKDKKLVAGKAMDNRAGVAILDELIIRLRDKKLPNKTYFVGTTQEEVGTRGAKTSVSKINPDIAIAIDTCAAHDTFGAISGIQKLGNGAALRIKDGGTLMDPKFVQYIMDIAKKHNIPVYKYVAQGGGTDAAELQYGANGVATITISLPQRYLHSPLGVCHLDDLHSTIDLIEKIILGLDQKTYDSIIKYK